MVLKCKEGLKKQEAQSSSLDIRMSFVSFTASSVRSTSTLYLTVIKPKGILGLTIK